MRYLRLLTVVVTAAAFSACGQKTSPPSGEPPEPQKTAAEAPVAEGTAVEGPAAEAPAARPRVDEVDFGKFKVNLTDKRIEIGGRFCLERGILDYFAVITGGQEYESVVALQCKGAELHAGLLALGAEPGPTQEVIDALRKNPPPGRKIPERPGTALDVTVEWQTDGATVSQPAARFLFNRKEKTVQRTGHWVFTGSYFAKDPETNQNLYMADVDKVLAGLVYTPSAVIGFSHDAGNPYSAQDEGYEVNHELVPKAGTPVKVIITLAKPQ